MATFQTGRLSKPSHDTALVLPPVPVPLQGTSRAAPTGPFSEAIIRVLVQRGFGVAALCFFLALTREALLELVVRLDLATPIDSAFRPRGGVHAWNQDDYRRLFEVWEANWRCGAIAETLGRSKSSIWAKARRLGLPKRDRQNLVQPDLIPVPRTRLIGLPATTGTAEIWPPPATVREWKARGTTEDVTCRRKSGRDNEMEWDTEFCRHFARRCWSGQRNSAIARDLGISLRAVTSMKHRFEIPKLSRDRWMDTYDPEAAAKNIAAEGYVERPCRSNPKYTYWLKPRLHTISRRDRANGFR